MTKLSEYAPTDTTAGTTWPQRIRLITGFLLITAMIAIFVVAARDSRDDLSSIQATQIYTSALFEAVTVIGIAIGVYFATGEGA